MKDFDTGKLITIALVISIFIFFFWDKVLLWYTHYGQMDLELKNIVYTKNQYYAMKEDEKQAFISDVSSLCVRKHYLENLNCEETTFWFANSLEEKGVDNDLIIELMQTCTDACKTEKPKEVKKLKK